MGITEKLGRFAAETPPSDVPAAAIESAKLRCLDILGVMVAGSRHPSALIALLLTALASPPARAAEPPPGPTRNASTPDSRWPSSEMIRQRTL